MSAAEILEFQDEAPKPKYDGFLDVAGTRVEIGKRLYADISNNAYHKSPGLSSTQLKNWKPASPAPLLFDAYQRGEVTFGGSEATALGTAYHALMLTPMTWQDEVQVWPEFPQGKKTKGKADLKAAHPEITFLEQDALDTAMRMRDVAMAHPEVAYLFKQMAEIRDGVVAGQVEVSGWYNDLNPHTAEGTFQLCKYRPDMRHCPEWSHNTWLADLKTTRDASPQGFARSIQDFGYHISAAHYLEGDQILHGRRPKQFIFVAQETEAPYLVAVYVLEEKAIKHGMKLRRRALEGIHIAKKTGEWPHYHYNKAVMIDLPQYVYNHEDFV
jgi:hypothetical protein